MNRDIDSHETSRAARRLAWFVVALLVPVALSCTHVGISSLRIEGAWMVIGQGAGVAAALAAKQGVTVQDLPYAKLRERLLAQKQALELPVAGDGDKK